MPIQFPADAPENAHQIIEEQLAGRITTMAPNLAKRSAVETMSVSKGYRVWHAQVQSIADGKLLAGLDEGNWRYLITDSEQATGEIELTQEAKGIRVVALHGGPRAGGTAAGLKSAQVLNQVQKSDYEIRFVECPGLFFVALWLHGESDDIIIPVEPDQTELEKYGAFTEAEVVDVLQKRAAEILAAQETAPGPSGG